MLIVYDVFDVCVSVWCAFIVLCLFCCVLLRLGCVDMFCLFVLVYVLVCCVLR